MLLTNLIFEPRGKHDPALTYSIKDTVMSPDGSKVYFALRDVPSGIALTDEDYWMLQIDLSGSKNAMDEAVAAFSDYAKIVGTRVKGETAKATGNPVSFLPDAGSLLQPVTVLEPQQQGSGDPSPSNIRLIIGYDKLDLNRAGKNILPNNSSTQTINGITFTVNRDGSITANGTATADAILILVTSTSNPELRNVLMGNQITISGCPSGGSSTTYDLRIFQYADANTYLMDYGSGITATFTNAELPFNVAILIRSGVSVSNLVFRPQIELGSTASDFQPYTNTLHAVQIGQTVYGFRYEWLTGKAWIEWAMATLDGTETFQTSNYGAYFYFYVYTAPTSSDGSVINVVSSHFKGVAESDRMGSEPLVYLMSDHNAVEFRNTGFADVTEWKAFLAAQKAAGTPVQVCWKLVTPIEIQLTPQIISAVEPEQNNTLYGDGSIEVEYVKPLHVSIEERVAAALAAAAE